MVGAKDLDEAEVFFDGIFGILGLTKVAEPTPTGGRRLVYGSKDLSNKFYVTQPLNGKPATPANGGTIGLGCATTKEIDAVHAKAVELGGKAVEDPPGYRASGAYLAYFLDPTGNKYCLALRG